MPAVTRWPCFAVLLHALGLGPPLVKNVPLSLRVTRNVPSLFCLTLQVRMLVSVAQALLQVPLSGTTISAEKRLCPAFLALPFPPGSAKPAVASARTPARRT